MVANDPGYEMAGYYNTVSASYGFQAGVQKFGYAMFFMNDASLNYLRKSRGWEVGMLIRLRSYD